ncbi:putative ribonuclease H-like domain-containing protein [Tanacetum coccineum]
MPFNRTTAPKAKFSNRKVNTAEVKAVSAVGGKRKTVVKPSTGKGPNWLFDLDYLTDSMNYQPVRSENQANKTAGPEETNHSAVKRSEAKNGDVKPNRDTGPKTNEDPKDQEDQAFLEELERLKRQEKEANDAAEVFSANSTNIINTASTPISTASPSNVFSAGGPDLNNNDQDDSQIPALEDIYDNPSDGIFTNASYDDEGAVADFTNLETTVNVSPIPTSRIHSIHPTTQILGDPTSAVQTRSKVHKNEPEEYLKLFKDESWVDAMQEELLQFKIQKVWILVDLPFGKRAIRTKWVYRNKKDERGFVDPKFPKKVYKVEKALYGLHQAPRAWYATLSAFLLKNRYRRGTIDKTLFIKKDKNDIMFVQVYVDAIIFGSTKRSWCDEFGGINEDRFLMEFYAKSSPSFMKTASTPIETQKPLTKDEEAVDVDVHLYRSMIGKLQKTHISCCEEDSLGTSKANQNWALRLCKKQKIMATSTTEAEYVAAANCYGQVLWIQNQMLDYGFNFMNTEIYIDNESTICIVKNPMLTQNQCIIEIRHHFIRDAYEKKLIQVLKIHTDDNVADLLTKAFDVSRTKLSTARTKLSTDSTKIESMKLEAIVEEKRIFKCWFHYHTTNGHQFTMSNRHQELASPKQTTSGKNFLNPLMADSLPKTIW